MRRPETTKILVIIDASRGYGNIEKILALFEAFGDVSGVVLHARGDEARVTEDGRGRDALLNGSRADLVAYVPCDLELDPAQLQMPEVGSPDVISPLLPLLRKQPQDQIKWQAGESGWIAPLEAARLLQGVADWSLTSLIDVTGKSGKRWRYSHVPVHTDTLAGAEPNQKPLIHRGSRVLAIIPHFKCEQWLDRCLYSLVTQSRPPDNIVVVDDSSLNPPLEIVSAFPEVTLLTTPENIGPERILHEIIYAMDFDAFMVQDADDWSSLSRLEHSLAEAERTGAGLVSTHELRLLAEGGQPILQLRPSEVNQSIEQEAGHYAHRGLIARSVAKAINGFDVSLRVAADTDFTLRAARVCRIINVPAAHYYRNLRPGSLTTAADTGHGSLVRTRERDLVYARARELGPHPNLPGISIPMNYICGPNLPIGSW